MRHPAPLPITRLDDALTFAHANADADGRAAATTPGESENSSSTATCSLDDPPRYRHGCGRQARNRRPHQCKPILGDALTVARPQIEASTPAASLSRRTTRTPSPARSLETRVSLRISSLGRVKRARRYSRANQGPEAASGSQNHPQQGQANAGKPLNLRTEGRRDRRDLQHPGRDRGRRAGRRADRATPAPHRL